MTLFQKKWFQWLLVWLGGIIVGLALAALCYFQGLITLAKVLVWCTAVLALGWLFWGLWAKRQVRFIKVTGLYVVSGLVVLLLSVAMATSGHEGGAVALSGIWAMAVSFVVGLLLIRLILRPGWPIFGVARTLIDEAIRMKVALVFIVALLLLVPILPVVTAQQDRLEYRIQAFLSWSLTASSVLLGLLTMFLACSTIAGEISSKRIYMTMTKPISRLEFLLGKWLGIVLLDALLLLVIGLSVLVFARVLQLQQTSQQDRIAVDQQVLVARQSVTPVPLADLDFLARYEQRLEQLRAEQPDRYGDKINEKDRAAIQKSIIAAWQTIGPGQSSVFMFDGLGVAKKYNTFLQLRFKAKAGGSTPDEMVHMIFRFNDEPVTTRTPTVDVAQGTFQVRNLYPQAIQPNGQLRLEVINLAPPVEQGGVSITFPPGDGLEVLYRTGSFEGNLTRSLVVTLTKLSFVAMLGLAAGTFLSFPVAVLLTMLIYVTASGSAFLSESLIYYAGYTDHTDTWSQMTGIMTLLWQHMIHGQLYDFLKLMIRLVGESFVAITPAFGHYDTVATLADGREISIWLTWASVWRIGLLGTGVCGLIGWLIFRRRELARVTV